jgi:DNA primase
VIVATDADRAGQQAAYRAFWQLAARSHNPDHTLVPHGKDPAELLQTNGPGALCTALENAGCLGDHVITIRTSQFADRLDTVEGRVYALRAAAQVIVALPPDQWQTQAAAIAEHLGVDQHFAIGEIIEASTPWTNNPIDVARQLATDKIPDLPPPTPPAHPDPTIRWAPAIAQLGDGITDDPHWPILAGHLTRAADTGFNVDTRLLGLIADRPLDPRHRARDLDFRLIDAWHDCLLQPDLDAVQDNRAATASAARDRMAAADRRHANQAVQTAPENSPPTTRRRPDEKLPTTTPRPPAPTLPTRDPHHGPHR